MIDLDLALEPTVLRRFVVELEQQAPRDLRAAPVLATYTPEAIEAARLAWASRIFDEYRSVAIFAELLRLLADREAPFAATCAVQRLIGDELRHTQLTATVVEWLGGSSDLAIDLRDPGLPPRPANESPAERALRIIARELVVAEEESVYALVAYRDATTDPAIRAVFELLLVDEVRHAATGRALLAIFERGALAAETATLRADLPALMAADRADLRTTYSNATHDGPGRALGACITRADLDAIWRRAA